MDVDKVRRFLEEACEVRGDSCYNKRTGRRVHALLPVHVLGLACDMDRLVDLARRYHLRIVEDAAEGLGVRSRGRHLGLFGDVGCLSFNGNKVMTTGGGGMVLTNRRDAAERARYLTTQAKDDAREYYHKEVGYNYRLTSLQAAVGLAELEQLPTFLAKKRRIAECYRNAFAGMPHLEQMPEQEGAAYWLYTVLVENRVQRDALLARLAHEHIEARPLWRPIHTLPPYEGYESAGPIEVAMGLSERGVSLPSSVGLTDDELKQCVRVVGETVGVQHVPCISLST